MNWFKSKLKNIFKKRVSNHTRLNIKAVIRWEQLNKKPFSQLSYNSEDEVLSLFYVCTLSSKIEISLEEFRKNLTEKDVKAMIKNFERQTYFTSQFQATSKEKSSISEDSSPIYIKDIVATLVMNGLDVHFAMNKMELSDLPIFLQAYDQKIKDKLTAQRLWAFLQLSPHLSKGATPKDIHPFAWEMEEETISEAEMGEGKQEAIRFFQTGLKK